MSFLDAPSRAADKDWGRWSLRSGASKAVFAGRRLAAYMKREGAEGTVRRIRHYMSKERGGGR